MKPSFVTSSINLLFIILVLELWRLYNLSTLGRITYVQLINIFFRDGGDSKDLSPG